jgi:hypothetical protein
MLSISVTLTMSEKEVFHSKGMGMTETTALGLHYKTALGLHYKGSQLPNDPRDLFLPVVTGTSDYQQYQPSELATKVWKS